MKKFFSLLLIGALVFNMGFVFADSNQVARVSGQSANQGLSMTFEVEGALDSFVKEGLIQASFSLYDKNKQLLETQSLKASMYNYEYSQYRILFNVPTKAGDVFFLSVDSKSENLGFIISALTGFFGIKELKRIDLNPFFSEPGGPDGDGGSLQFEGNASNPIRLNSILLKNSTEALVPVTVNGVPTEGVEFIVYGSDAEEVIVKPTDSKGFLHIPYTTELNYTLTLKGEQVGYIDPTIVYQVSNTGYQTIGRIDLIREKINVWSGDSNTLISTGSTTEESTLRFAVGSPNVNVSGMNEVLDVAPFIVNGRTQVPLRFIGEQLGATIGWDAAERMVTYTTNDVVIKLWIDKPIATVNGVSVALDVAPFIVNGRTVVPIRFVSENLGASVEWISETKEILITK